MNVLVLNMGMKSIRSIIFDETGKKLSSAGIPLSSIINEDRVEQIPDEWWSKGLEAMKKSIHDAKIKSIDYMTVTTSASCLLCIDEDGNPLDNCVMVSDKRAKREVEEIKKTVTFKEVYEQTGLDVTVSLLLPKILWYKNNAPEVFGDTRWFLTPNDYLIYKLCGEVVTDYLNAYKYHYDGQSYPIALLNEIGIPVKKLPTVVDTGSYAGKIDESVADEIGIKSDTKIVVTSYDAICSFIGSGVADEGEASDVSGTVTVFRTLSKKEHLSGSKRVYLTPFNQGNFNIIGGSNNLGGGLIEWVKQCYYMKEEYPYEVMEKEAGESDLGARGIIFLPYLLGERAPIWNDNARGVFFGLERMHTRKDMTRAVFESTAFIDRTIMDAIGETSAEVTSVRVSGGLARVNLVSNIKADVIGREVKILSEFETTASGSAMMVLNGQEHMSFSDLSKNFAKVRMAIYPDMENHKKYNEIYELFKETYQTSVPLFDRRVEILESIRSHRETQIENL